MDKYTKQRLFLTEQQEAFFINEMQRQYGLSYKSIRKILIDYVDRYGTGNKLNEKMFMYRRFENLLSNVADEIKTIKNVKFAPFNSYVSKIGELNYLFAGYTMESKHFIPLNFKPLNQEELGMSKLSKLALRVRDAELYNNLERTITQSIVNADGVGETAKAIRNIMDIDLNKSLRIARTETTTAMGEGNRKAMKKAESKGLDLKKQWVATLDKKTRDRHRRMDGEIRDLNEKYSNGLMYPGDPRGRPEEIINCRCLEIEILNTEQDEYKKLERRARENDFNNVIKNTTYKEWEKGVKK